MSVLDFSLPPDFQLLMGDAPNVLDLTPALASFNLAQPLCALGTPLIWSASITIAAVAGFPESLDKVDNFSRWQRGKHPIRLFLYGELIVTLRLRSYHYDADTGMAEITATDLLGLLDFERTASANASFKTQSKVVYDGPLLYPFMPRLLALRNVLINGSVLNGVQYIRDEQIITSNLPDRQPNGQPDGFTVDQGTGKTNPIVHAQEIVDGLGFWAWCDPEESIRFAKYPTDAVVPARRYAYGEVEEFKPKEPDFDASPPSTVTAIGTHIVSVKVLNKSNPEEARLIPPGFGVSYPIVTEAKGDDGIVVQRTTRYGSANDPYNRVIVEKSLASLMPDDHPDDNTLIVANDRSNTADYNEQGYLDQLTTIDLQPLGAIASETFPGETAFGETLTTESWRYDSNGVPLEKEIISVRPGYAVFGDEAAGSGATFYEGEVETWTPIGTRKYEHLIVKSKPRGTIADTKNPYDATPSIVQPTEPDFLDAPPSAPRKPATDPAVAKPQKADANVAPKGETEGYAGRKSIIRFSCCIGLDNAAAIAQQQAHIEWQRHAAYNVVRPFDPLCDLKFVPLQREDVHNRSLVRDGYTITIGSDGLSVAYTGNLMGKIAAIPQPYEAPAIVPILPTIAVPVPPAMPLTLAPLPPALSFATNVPMSPLALATAGGAGSATVSATGLPPGLSIVGSQILGNPSIPGNYSVTIAISDGRSSVSETVTIAIAPAAVPIPFWQLILSADDGSYSQGSARAQLQAFAGAGSYWRDSVVAVPLSLSASGSYSLDSAVAAIADSGSYSLDRVGLLTRYSSTQATLQGSASMTNIQAFSVDDGSVGLGDFGFDFRYYDGTFRTNVYIGSNSYITFGFGSSSYSALSHTNPGRALHLGSRDVSYQNVYVQASANAFRVRYEGAQGTSGVSTRLIEVTFFSDGAIMVVKQTPDNSGLWTVTKGDGVAYTDFAPSTETSFVIVPNADFTVYTVQPGSYI
jgi:hypothetical protein